MVGGLLLVLGLFTRLVAFVVAGEWSDWGERHRREAARVAEARRGRAHQMAVAYFMAHAPGNLYPIKNHGELAVLLCFVFLYFAVAGGGRLSVDAVWRG